MADYTSDYSFQIDGVSSNTYGIFVATLDPVPTAEQRYTTGFTGAPEPYAIPDNVFKPITYTITFYKFFPDSMDDSAIRLFLSKGSVLQLSNYPLVYFKILTITHTTRQTADNKRIEYNVTFTLKPFKYGVSNDWITLSKGDTVVNSGTYSSRPLIELTAPEGTVKITVNGSDFTVENLNSGSAQNPSKYYIDSDRYIVYFPSDYYESNRLHTGYDSGLYPELLVGNNTITWTGTVDAVKIKTNWREI